MASPVETKVTDNPSYAVEERGASAYAPPSRNPSSVAARSAPYGQDGMGGVADALVRRGQLELGKGRRRRSGGAARGLLLQPELPEI